MSSIYFSIANFFFLLASVIIDFFFFLFEWYLCYATRENKMKHERYGTCEKLPTNDKHTKQYQDYDENNASSIKHQA